jgi:hypothetical protein
LHGFKFVMVALHLAAMSAFPASRLPATRTSRGWSNRCQRWSWFCIHSVFSLASVPALFAFGKQKLSCAVSRSIRRKMP